MFTIRVGRRLAFVAVAAIGLALPAGVAAADRTARTGADGAHCVAHLEQLQAGQPQSRIARQVCFNTFAQAISYATHGRTALPSNATPAVLTQAMLPDSLDSEFVIGIDYEHRDFDTDFGASKVWTASTGCDPGHWYVLSDLAGTGWNDRISSAKGYSGCIHFRHFENANYGGAVVTCTCSYIGDAMNDRTSSLQFDD